MKKGQAAMEFLMTYGWAVLTILIVMGVLAYLVMTNDSMIPNQCRLGVGFNCKSFKAQTTGVTLIIGNFVGKDVTITSVSLPEAGCNGSVSVNIPREEDRQVDVNCTLAQGKVKSELVVYYDETDGLSNISSRGRFVAKVS